MTLATSRLGCSVYRSFQLRVDICVLANQFAAARRQSQRCEDALKLISLRPARWMHFKAQSRDAVVSIVDSGDDLARVDAVSLKQLVHFREYRD